ncbi:MAG: acyltransferase [Lachnospiraceae bacterium]|nr:acyltransferase [Lachnospiraceae bacterium]MDD6035013.1 acyltransferase [Lachnospiraceae bacterium]
MNNVKRKNYLDNIRWITILIVVAFHVFYYYNNIGVTPMFTGLSDNPVIQGGAVTVTFGGVFQYAVYQWFMLLLFIVSGICARGSLERKTKKQFLKDRALKLLVPSTLGILTIQWVGGYLIYRQQIPSEEAANIPGVAKYLICAGCGIGALWFCQVLFFSCLLLVLIKAIDRKDSLLKLGSRTNIVVLILLAVVMIGAAQILNVPMITTYRMCYYPLAFLLGYYVFSHDKVLLTLKKWALFFLTAGIAFGVVYIVKFYGTYYAEYEVLNRPVSVLHAYFTALGVIGVGQYILNFANSFTAFMNKAGWGIYICHIFVLLLTNTLLIPVVGRVPMFVVYLIGFVAAIFGSIVLWEVLKRIPVIRYLLFGIKRSKK